MFTKFLDVCGKLSKWVWGALKQGFRLLLTILLYSLVIVIYSGAFYYLYKPEPKIKLDKPLDIVQEVYYNLGKETGRWDELPPVYMIPNSYDEINAFASDKYTLVTYGLVYGTDRNKDMIAVLIGHEIAHFLLGHVYNRVKETDGKTQRIRELEADQLGAFLVMRSGYNICEGVKLWAKLYESVGDLVEEEHPPNSMRYNMLKMPFCR